MWLEEGLPGLAPVSAARVPAITQHKTQKQVRLALLAFHPQAIASPCPAAALSHPPTAGALLLPAVPLLVLPASQAAAAAELAGLPAAEAAGGWPPASFLQQLGFVLQATERYGRAVRPLCIGSSALQQSGVISPPLTPPAQAHTHSAAASPHPSAAAPHHTLEPEAAARVRQLAAALATRCARQLGWAATARLLLPATALGSPQPPTLDSASMLAEEVASAAAPPAPSTHIDSDFWRQLPAVAVAVEAAVPTSVPLHTATRPPSRHRHITAVARRSCGSLAWAVQQYRCLTDRTAQAVAAA